MPELVCNRMLSGRLIHHSVGHVDANVPETDDKLRACALKGSFDDLHVDSAASASTLKGSAETRSKCAISARASWRANPIPSDVVVPVSALGSVHRSSACP